MRQFNMAAMAVLACASLALGACTQDLAGITKVHYGVDSNGQPEISYESGKEASSISASYEQTPDGVEITVDAGDVKAFEGQQIRAEVHKAIADAVKDVLPDVLKTGLCAAGVVSAC